MNRKKRIASIDILRGLDLFFLVFLQPVIVAIGQVVDNRYLNVVLFQLDHEVWEGFRVWDIVMPLFLFMVGASMPFSFEKYKESYIGFGRRIYCKIFKRFSLLFLLGMVVQGNLLALDLTHIYIYNNTLQAIAVGYLLSAVIILNCSLKWQVGITLGLLIVYWIPMRWCGDYSVHGSFAYYIDEILLSKFRGDTTYTWIWSSLTFTSTVMLGSFAGRIIGCTIKKQMQSVLYLLIIGILMIVCGLIWSIEMPVIKRLWTSSMVLFSAGICYILMSIFHYIIDCRGWIHGLGWLKIYGMNAITAYVAGEIIDFRSIVASISFGLSPLLNRYYDVWLTFGNYLILFFILKWMYKNKIFIKI